MDKQPPANQPSQSNFLPPEDDELFGDNVEASVAADRPSVLHQMFDII